MPIITLITDYGTRDHYVGAMKGVILSIAPDATVVDITHDVEPQHVLNAAFILRQSLTWFPEGTIHVAVVDPGVGTDRRIILGRYNGRYVLVPDNGLLTLVHRDLAPESLHVVEDRRCFLSDLSTTFHGRDIFAPVAAQLANGARPQAFGRSTDRLEVLSLPYPAAVTGEVISGRALYVDHFGTLVTNIRQEQLPGGCSGPSAAEGSRGIEKTVWVNGVNVGPIRSTFCDVPVGEPLALVGGTGMVEVAVNQGRAVDRFGLPDDVRIEIR